jgi:hypothetical protein
LAGYLLLSVIRDERGFATASVFSPAFKAFYDVRGDLVTRIEALCVNAAGEAYLAFVYVQLDFGAVYSQYFPNLPFVPRVPRVRRFVVVASDVREDRTTRPELLDRDPSIVHFHYDPSDDPFPSLPLQCVCGAAVLAFPAQGRLFQLVWVQFPSTSKFQPRPLAYDADASAVLADEVLRRVGEDVTTRGVLARVVDHAIVCLFKSGDVLALPVEGLVCYNPDAGLLAMKFVRLIVVNFAEIAGGVVKYKDTPLVLANNGAEKAKKDVRRILSTTRGFRWFRKRAGGEQWEEIQDDIRREPHLSVILL